MANLLLNRNYHVDGTWFEPQKFLKNFKSVVRAEYLEQSSSAGDWTGYVLQKIGKTFYVILFCQTNSYPAKGFDVATDSNEMYSFTGKEPTKKELEEMIWNITNL